MLEAFRHGHYLLTISPLLTCCHWVMSGTTALHHVRTFLSLTCPLPAETTSSVPKIIYAQAVTRQQAAERANARRLAKQRTLDEFLGASPDGQACARPLKSFKCRLPARTMKRLHSLEDGS